MTNEQRERVIVAVTTDLLARSRIEDAAARAGWRLEIVSAQDLRARIESLSPEVLVLDLDAGREDLIGHIAEPGTRSILPARTVGFFSHVDTALGAAAAPPGCKVMPRGKFWRSLAQLLDEGLKSDP